MRQPRSPVAGLLGELSESDRLPLLSQALPKTSLSTYMFSSKLAADPMLPVHFEVIIVGRGRWRPLNPARAAAAGYSRDSWPGSGQ
jgi:hypothetical protein